MMKRLQLTLLVLFMALSATNAENVFSSNDLVFKEIVCQIKSNHIKGGFRAPAQLPSLFLSELNIYILSEDRDFTDAHLILMNAQGVEVIDKSIQIYSGQENFCYIGDLISGTYYIQLTVCDVTLEGSFDIE